MGLKENLKYFMDLKGVNVSQLARTSSTPKQRISAWLTGKEVRNLNHLKRVADSLEVTLDDLLFRPPVKSSRKFAWDRIEDEQTFQVTIKRVGKK